MLDNNKCILVYNVPTLELAHLRKTNLKIVEISKDMTDMTVKDIINGLKFETLKDEKLKEKVILLNNFSDKELHQIIKNIRLGVKGGILAVVTPTSIKWTFDYLVKHLIEEREWHLKQQKGR